MSFVDIIFSALGFAGNVPALAKILLVVVGIAPALAALITGLVSLWHAVVVVLKAISALPGCGSIGKLADELSVSEASVEAKVNSSIIPLLNRLSALPLPSKAAPVAGK